MNRLALLAAAATLALSGAAFAQTNDSGNTGAIIMHPNAPSGPARMNPPAVSDDPSSPGDFDEQTSQLPNDTTPNQQSSVGDSANTPNTPMQNGGLPNGEGSSTGSGPSRY